MVIRDPEAYALLADETRRKILYLLRVKEMTVGQVASELGVTSQAIYHHMKKLLKGNMVEVVKEERSGHLIESYYRATAEDFLLTQGKTKAQTLRDRKQAEEEVTASLNALNKIGLEVELNEDAVSQLVDLRLGLEVCCADIMEKEEQKMDEIWNMDNLSLTSRSMTMEFFKMIMMSDKEFAESQEKRMKLRDLLCSLTESRKKRPPKIAASPPIEKPA